MTIDGELSCHAVRQSAMSDSRQVDMERKRGGADRLAVSSPADDVETWARLMKKLLHEACHRVNKSTTKTLSEAERLAVRKRYRTILTQGDKELPENPPRPKGKRGRIAAVEASVFCVYPDLGPNPWFSICRRKVIPDLSTGLIFNRHPVPEQWPSSSGHRVRARWRE